MLSARNELYSKHSIKIGIRGERGVGKTSIVNRYVNDSFTYTYGSAIGSDYYRKNIPSSSTSYPEIALEIIDFYPEKYCDSNPYKHVDVAIIVCDLTDAESFCLETLQSHKDYIQKECGNDHCIFILAANKLDFPERRQISRENLQKLGEELGCCKTIEVSTKEKTNITALFKAAINAYLYKKHPIVATPENGFSTTAINEQIGIAYQSKIATMSSSNQKYIIGLENSWRQNSHLTEADKIIVLLKDYTKNNSALLRFFTGHWNRHHIAEISAIITLSRGKSANSLLEELKSIQLVNQSGTVASIIFFLQHKLHGQVVSNDLDNYDRRASTAASMGRQ